MYEKVGISLSHNCRVPFPFAIILDKPSCVICIFDNKSNTSTQSITTKTTQEQLQEKVNEQTTDAERNVLVIT